MRNTRSLTCGALLVALLLCVVMLMGAATAESPALVVDTNPAIAVAKDTANSVVGVAVYDQGWNRRTGETTESIMGQGSGVVIKDGGYILTNNHVVESGSSFKVLLPSGEEIDAQLIGSDDSTDLAVLKVETDETLVPVAIGEPDSLPVGSTVIAIGNPGGSILANTVTSGVISALERDVGNSIRNVTYIQHDAAISSGNSGGGLFDVNGRLIGINTLKYAGSMFYGGSYEGLGFAIPVNTASPVAEALIEHGKVLRPQMGVVVSDYSGPDEPMNNYPPASVAVYQVTPGTPAAEAGVQPYDFITEVDGVRVKSLRELTRELDKHKEGDSVELTIVRYKNPSALGLADAYSMQISPDSQDGQGDNEPDSGNYYTDPFGGFFGNPFGGGGNDPYGYGNSRAQQSLGGYETIKLSVALKILN